MRKTTMALLAVGALMAPSAAEAGIQDIGVAIRDSEFDPAGVRSLVSGIEPRVTWAGDSSAPPDAEHNVRETRKIFYSGPPQTWNGGETFSRIFSAGIFDYRCEQHPFTMTGRVRIKMGQDSVDGLPLMIWATTDTNTGNAFDVQFKVNDGPWRNWKVDTERTQGVFGRNGRPVAFDDVANDYRFRARSQKRVETSRRVSRWSPAVLFD